MKRWLKNSSLSIVLAILFLLFLGGMSVAGHRNYNEEQIAHGQPEITYADYVVTGNFMESVFENWESEFLQMASYVALTVFLFQKGSVESKKLEEEEAFDRDPKNRESNNVPWPVRSGGFILKLYENSLLIAFALLFLLSFWLHAYGGARATTEENLVHDQPAVSTIEYMQTSKFWFESLQNWESEYLAVFSIVVLSIWLRQKGSPESKPVDAPHSKTGG